jgi:predicted SnoaL-like aldol condensation-catalyzing enzyme
MKLNVFLSVLSVASAASYCPSRGTDDKAQLASWRQFVDKFYFKKDVYAAFEDHIDHNFIEHNPGALSGWTNRTSIAGLAGLITSANFTVINEAFYNNTGYIHFRQDVAGDPPTAIVDVFRFNGTCIVEHVCILLNIPSPKIAIDRAMLIPDPKL